jgi:hypothetical protein
MTDFFANWDGPVALMSGKAKWGIESWVFPSSEVGTISSTIAQPTPVNLRSRKRNFKYGFLFSSQEIQNTIGSRAAALVGIGFHCKRSPNFPLVDYEIKVQNSNLNSLINGWGPTGQTLIKTSIKPLSENWFFLGPFPDSGQDAFIWDGESNLYFEITWKRSGGIFGSGRGSILQSTSSDFHKSLFSSAGKGEILDEMPFEFGAPRPATILKWKI